ncbi:uncharacterized protein LAJ45_03637 [Morchella importuna]|uniref:uncharacterized protein n=1 Tax=Morchella importuna TaxID=1174673 RepID=UPI001E8CD5D9|nr:uncharacterized protein LAJ45_03637 [Morchella importuna]KAH8152211.1 hypothetical protein LAJ45_03637 [Morchella importuna]
MTFTPMVRHGTGPRYRLFPAPMFSAEANSPMVPSVELIKASHKKEDEHPGLQDEYLGTEDEYTGTESSSSGSAASEGDKESVNSKDRYGTPGEYLETEDEHSATEDNHFGSESHISETGISEDDDDHNNDPDRDVPDRIPATKRARKVAARTATPAAANGGKIAKRGAKDNKSTRTQKRIKAEPSTSDEEREDIDDSAQEVDAAEYNAKRKRSRIDNDDSEPYSSDNALAIFIDGYGFDVPVDPVECFHKVRKHVLKAYRRVAARRGTKKDLAVRAAEESTGGDLEEGRKVKKYRAAAANNGKQGDTVKGGAIASDGERRAMGLSIML